MKTRLIPLENIVYINIINCINIIYTIILVMLFCLGVLGQSEELTRKLLPQGLFYCKHGGYFITVNNRLKLNWALYNLRSCEIINHTI